MVSLALSRPSIDPRKSFVCQCYCKKMHDGSISELFEVTVNAEALDLQATKSSSRKSTPKKKYIPVPLESRQRSAAWHYFIKAEVVGTSQCNVCKEVVKHANNTSNLLKHLQTKHPDQYRQAKRLRKEDEKAGKKVKKSKAENERKTTIKKVAQDKPKTSWTITRSESIDQALVRMIATDMQPASIVDDPGFQALVRLLDSRYQLPSKKHIMTGLLPDMYSKRVEEIKQELAQIPHVALTSEVWSFRTTERYLTINCHFLTSSWELKSVVLETFGYKSEYTAESIAATFQRVAAEWGISQKIAAMVTDDSANVVAAVRLTGWMQVPCFAHTLNQVVSEAIIADARINELRKNCREVVSFFHASVEATEKLKEIQLQVGVPEHKLIQEVETRWTSTYYMFERIIEQCQAITTVLCLCGRSDLCLSSYHVSLLEASVRVLKPFEATTKELSADKYAISKVIPLAKSLQRLTDAIASDDTPLVSGLRAQMQMRFTGIESSHILAMSALVDPRMKKMAFRDSGALQQGEQLIIQEMSKLAPASSGEDAPLTEAPQDSGLWDLFDTTVRESHSQETGTNNVTLEARKFFEQPVLPRHEDPLIWWRANERYYELLGKVAKKYLCIPGTSVPAERLFSKAGELISLRRDRLKPKHVNMFLFLNKNL